MRIVITGANGFVAKNLRVQLQDLGYDQVACLTRDTARGDFEQALIEADFVFHLAGVNRPKDNAEFTHGNVDLTREICRLLRHSGRAAPIVFSSSTQAAQDNPYGLSKAAAEDALHGYASDTGARVHVLRLTNVFGKWCKPNYNSAVATFCHNIARGLPIVLHDPEAPLSLVYVDDVVDVFVVLLRTKLEQAEEPVMPIYSTTVGAAAAQIRAFKASRDSLMTERVGTGLTRALYATYVSYLPCDDFSYAVPRYEDPRGSFVEMLKTRDSGQFSFFTAHPGVTRGSHYHRSKTEKFLIIRGEALFRFRHIVNQERFEISVSQDSPRIVESIPGWAHDVTNTGTTELVVMLWANEVFDRNRPDTYARGP